MPLSQKIFEFRDERSNFKKERITFTANKERLDNMLNAISRQSTHFKMLNKSEQIDFLLYFAEKAMANSEIINLTPVYFEKSDE